MNFTPIALVGGGLTTKIFACTLLHCGFDFTWFQGSPASAPASSDKRTTTIHHAGKLMLEALGLWHGLAPHSWPLHEIKISITPPPDWTLTWHSESPAPAPAHTLPLAYVVPNAVLHAVLSSALAHVKGHALDVTALKFSDLTYFTVLDEQGGDKQDSDKQRADKQGSDKQEWACDLLIACDGTHSRLRASAGLSAFNQGRGQTALVGMVQTALPIHHRAYQRFLASGPLALMATDTHQASFVWSCFDAQAERYKVMAGAMDRVAFAAELSACFGPSLGTLTLVDEVLSWPLTPHFVPKIARPGFCCGGDAAHALHPLAGMGFNLALSDAAILLDILQQAKARGLPPHHPSITTAYQARRQTEITAMMALTQTLDRMLSRPPGLLTRLASTALSLLEHTTLKNQFRNIATGGKLSPAPLFEGSIF